MGLLPGGRPSVADMVRVLRGADSADGKQRRATCLVRGGSKDRKSIDAPDLKERHPSPGSPRTFGGCPVLICGEMEVVSVAVDPPQRRQQVDDRAQSCLILDHDGDEIGAPHGSAHPCDRPDHHRVVGRSQRRLAKANWGWYFSWTLRTSEPVRNRQQSPYPRRHVERPAARQIVDPGSDRSTDKHAHPSRAAADERRDPRLGRRRCARPGGGADRHRQELLLAGRRIPRALADLGPARAHAQRLPLDAQPVCHRRSTRLPTRVSASGRECSPMFVRADKPTSRSRALGASPFASCPLSASRRHRRRPRGRREPLKGFRATPGAEPRTLRGARNPLTSRPACPA